MNAFADLLTLAGTALLARWMWRVEIAADAAWDDTDQAAFDAAVNETRGRG